MNKFELTKHKISTEFEIKKKLTHSDKKYAMPKDYCITGRANHIFFAVGLR